MRKALLFLTVAMMMATASYAQTALPWSCDFATDDCGAIYEDDGTSSSWARSTSSGCAAPGMYHGYNGAHYDIDYVVWGPFTTPTADVVSLSYDLSISTWGDEVTVMYITNLYLDPNTNPGSWIVADGPYSASAACVAHSADLSGVLGSTQFWIAFRYQGQDAYYAYIDDLSLTFSSGPTATPTNTPVPAPGQNCASAIAINIPGSLPYSQAGTNCGLLNDYAATCLGSYDGGEDIIYQLVVATDTNVEISYTTTDTWTGILLDDSCPPDPTTCIDIATSSAAGTITLGQNLLAAGTYYLMLDTYPTPDCISSFTLNITSAGATATPTPTAPPAGPGDSCGNALPIASGDCLLGDYTGMTNNFDCGGTGGVAGGPDMVYTFTLADSSYVHILAESAGDIDLAVSNVCDASTATYLCADTSGSSTSAQTSCGDTITPGTYGFHTFYRLLPAGTYYIWLDSYSGELGDEFAIEMFATLESVTCAGCPIGGTPEGEPTCAAEYVDTFNAGCNAATPVFTTITPGTTICGQTGTYTVGTANTRDTDWYQITVASAADLIVEVAASFPSTTLIVPAVCPVASILASGSDTRCPGSSYEVIATVAAGDYYIIVLPTVFTDIPCGSASRYWMAVTTDVPSTPTPTPTSCASCPPGGTAENEPLCGPEYDDTYNGGCNSTVPVFQTITNGQTICGEAGTFTFGTDNYRDTDWFEFTLTETSDVTFSAYGDFPILAWLAATEDCVNYDFTQYDDADTCETATTIRYTMPAGDYIAIVMPSVFEGIPCGVKYVATLTWGPAAPTPTPTVTPPPAGPGDTCLNPITINCGDCVLGTTVGMNNNFSCGGLGAGPDVVYTFTLAEPQTIHIIAESDEDLDFAVTDVCDASTATFACSDRLGTPPVAASCGEAITPDTWGYFDYSATVDAGTYYIWIDTYSATGGGAFALELLCSDPPSYVLECPATSQLSQPVNPLDLGFNGFSSDLGGDFRYFDDYSVTDPVCWVKFWGLYTAGNDTDFTIEFWTDNAGQPGTLTNSYPITGATPIDTTWTAFGYPIYEYFVELPTCEAQLAGWISIQGASNGSTFYWAVNSSATGADCYEYQVSTTTWTPDVYDLAFCLGNAEPPTPTPLPVPTSGPFGLGVMIFAISALLGLSVLRKK